ncbi:MAG: hypothetical protein D3909_06210 [Candidatus Electrothrix sp. ATG1]|nr:hypothetical protein [Candidatus Electrothrix sp. ATG1]
MKYADLLQLKSVQIILLIVLFIGAFVLGKCLMPEPPEETLPVQLPLPEPKKEEGMQAVAKEEVRFDEQCRDVRLDAQWSLLPPLLPEGGWGTILYAEPEQQERPAPPIVLLKPLRKKRRIAQPGRSVQEDPPVVFGENGLLKPLRKKQRIALPKKSVQEKYRPDDIVSSSDDQFTCKGGLIPAVLTTVASLEARSILYGTGPLSDCSGIFHRVLMGVKKRCPDYKYPPLQQYRDSRDLARWYREQGELIWIKDALKRTDLIRPGMVLFYGHQGSVRHVGVVVSVTMDKKGKMISYNLFHGHGRRGRTAASTTSWHKRKPTRPGYPPFGNGHQRLIAAARIVRPVKHREAKK